MSDTPREDYELLCEDNAREIVRFMEGVSEVSFEGSIADAAGDDPDDPEWWDWCAILVLKMEYKNREYRIPVFCQEESGEVEFGDSDHPWGDTEKDVWRIIWISECDRE